MARNQKVMVRLFYCQHPFSNPYFAHYDHQTSPLLVRWYHDTLTFYEPHLPVILKFMQSRYLSIRAQKKMNFNNKFHDSKKINHKILRKVHRTALVSVLFCSILCGY